MGPAVTSPDLNSPSIFVTRWGVKTAPYVTLAIKTTPMARESESGSAPHGPDLAKMAPWRRSPWRQVRLRAAQTTATTTKTT